MIWVIPCKYHPVVLKCVDAIRLHHPGDTVCVVDSCSDDRQYLWDVDADLIIQNNTGYAWGAFGMAWKEYPGHERYALIHDSLIIQRNLTDRLTTPVTAVKWYPDWRLRTEPEFIDWFATLNCADLFDPLPHYNLLFGPMMFATHEVMAQLDQLGAWDIVPQDRIGANGMERGGGILLSRLNVDCTRQLDPSDYDKRFLDRP